MNYRNARYITDTKVDCEIYHEYYGWIPYTLDPDDTDMTINNDDLLAAMSEAGDVAAYVPPTQAELNEVLSVKIRNDRDILLMSEVDMVAGNALRWSSLSQDKQSEWSAYRIALLDVPQQQGFPNDVTWPTKPQ
mgnify:CR=1 FL=1|tara:strand:- start:131 stop:532 length:402 start_codon:yes stop_codon:yes gene_type:complete